jgi:hypothetical protein
VQVYRQTYLKDAQEKGSEMVKHFREKVPPHADVWSEIRHGQSGRQSAP